MDSCAYCGSDLTHYESVFVQETADAKRVPVGSFCNYACRYERIGDEDKLSGACCTIDC